MSKNYYLRLQVMQFTDAELRKTLKPRIGLRTIFGDILNSDWRKMAYGVLSDRRSVSHYHKKPTR